MAVKCGIVGLPGVGKSVLFKVFGDVDAVPICIDTKDPDKIIETVKLLQPSFAAIGANSRLLEAPAENSAISTPLNEFSSSFFTAISLPTLNSRTSRGWASCCRPTRNAPYTWRSY